MGVDVDSKYGGTGSTFFSAMLVIEELAKVDPSVSVFCDVQNTLVSQTFHRFASEEQKSKYLPRIANNSVFIDSIISDFKSINNCFIERSEHFVYLNPTPVQMPLR